MESIEGNSRETGWVRTACFSCDTCKTGRMDDAASKTPVCKPLSQLSPTHGKSHYVKISNRSHNICNGPLTSVTYIRICNGCYLVPVTDKRGRPTPGLASATPVNNVDFLQRSSETPVTLILCN
jgi:hypothetical protein